jgi:hypothetical protein
MFLPRKAQRRGRVAKATLAAAALVAIAGSASPAAAQNQILDLPTPSIVPPPLTGDIEAVGKRAFWRAGRTRWFFASTMEIGNLYLRGGGAVGYGKPHWQWVGVEGSSAISVGGGVAYGGLRFASPYVDLRAGARYTFAMGQTFVAPQPDGTYTREDREAEGGPPLRYVNLEAEVASGYPLFGGALFGIAGFYYVTGTPPGWNLFEQTLQVMAEPSILWRARAGYLKSVDRWDSFRVGGAVEVIGNPERDLVVVRLGPSVTTMITHHLEAFGSALFVVHSRDSIGLAGAQLGELGFRYRWATGDRWPEFP